MSPAGPAAVGPAVTPVRWAQTTDRRGRSGSPVRRGVRWGFGRRKHQDVGQKPDPKVV